MSNQQQNDSYYVDEMIRKVCLINTYLSYDAKDVNYSVSTLKDNKLETHSEKVEFDPKTERIIGLINHFSTNVEGQEVAIYGLKLFPAIDVDKDGKPYAYYESSRYKNKIFTRYNNLVRRIASKNKYVASLDTTINKIKEQTKKKERLVKRRDEASKFITDASSILKKLEEDIRNLNKTNINLSNQKINLTNKSEMKYYDFTTINSSVQYLSSGNEIIDLNYFKNEKMLGGNLFHKTVKKITSGSNAFELILAIRPQTDDGYVNNIELSVKSGSQNYLLGMMRLNFTDLCKFLFSTHDQQTAFIKNNIKNLMSNFNSTSNDKDNFWFKTIKKDDFTNLLYVDDTYKQLSSCLIYIFMLLSQPFDVSSTKNYTYRIHPLIVPKRSLLKDNGNYVSQFGVPKAMIVGNDIDPSISSCVRTIMYNSTFNPIFIKCSMNDFFKSEFKDTAQQIGKVKPEEKRKLMKRKIIYGRLVRMSSVVSYTNSIHSVHGKIAYSSKSRKNTKKITNRKGSKQTTSAK